MGFITDTLLWLSGGSKKVDPFANKDAPPAAAARPSMHKELPVQEIIPPESAVQRESRVTFESSSDNLSDAEVTINGEKITDPAEIARVAKEFSFGKRDFGAIMDMMGGDKAEVEIGTFHTGAEFRKGRTDALLQQVQKMAGDRVASNIKITRGEAWVNGHKVTDPKELERIKHDLAKVGFDKDED